MVTPTLFRSVDVAVFVAALTQRLRDAGVTVGLTSENRCCAAMIALPPGDPATMYWVTRTTLVHDRSEFAAFDSVFAAVFDAAGLPIAPWERDIGRTTVKAKGTTLRQSAPTDGLALAQGRVEGSTRPEISDGDDDEDARDNVVPEFLPTALQSIADTPFDALSLDELSQIGAWLESLALSFPTRPSRRFQRAGAGGLIDLRRTLVAARRTAGEPVLLFRRRVRRRHRRTVMVADVSGSMESFTRIYLHLMRTLVRQSRAEVFTFSTSLRRVTVQLRDGDPQSAIDRLTDEVTDRFGGTRIAGSIAELLRSPVWASSVRGATVVIASDGWDSEPPEHLAAQMARLQRIAHRVVWVNPRLMAADYEPTTGAMAAALPHIDEFLSGHSLSQMREILRAIAGER